MQLALNRPVRRSRLADLSDNGRYCTLSIYYTSAKPFLPPIERTTKRGLPFKYCIPSLGADLLTIIVCRSPGQKPADKNPQLVIDGPSDANGARPLLDRTVVVFSWVLRRGCPSFAAALRLSAESKNENPEFDLRGRCTCVGNTLFNEKQD